MASIELIQRVDKIRKDGTAPIFIRVTEARKSRYKSTGVRVPPNMWNPESRQVRKSHRRHGTLNDDLAEQLDNAKSIERELRRRSRGRTSAEAVKKSLDGKSGGSLLAYAEAYADRQEHGHYRDSLNIRVLVGKLRTFHGDGDIDFLEVDRSFLHRFDTYMRVEMRNRQNTRAKNFSVLKRVFRKAIADGLVALADDPFFDFQIRTERAAKQKLTPEEIDALADLDLDGQPGLRVSRDAFLFSFYGFGIRFGDLCQLRWRNVVDGRLTYSMMKTHTPKDIKLPQQALDILDRYRSEDSSADVFIFPFLDGRRNHSDDGFLRRQISSRNAAANRNLKKLAKVAGIGSSLSFHMSRHSFADYARRNGQDLYAISKALGHSRLRTTETYLAAFDRDVEDRLGEDLFG